MIHLYTDRPLAPDVVVRVLGNAQRQVRSLLEPVARSRLAVRPSPARAADSAPSPHSQAVEMNGR